MDEVRLMEWCFFLAVLPQGIGYKNKGVHASTTLLCSVKVHETCKEVLKCVIQGSPGDLCPLHCCFKPEFKFQPDSAWEG